jgi:hypothetical protein
MNVITLNKKAVRNAEFTGQREKVVSILSKLGAARKPVPLEEVKKACHRSIPSDARIRSHVRALAAEKIVIVRKQPKAA